MVEFERRLAKKAHAVTSPLRVIATALFAGIVPLIANCTGGNGSGDTAGPSVRREAILSWTPINAGNLSGYRVYVGTAPRTYIQPLGQGLDAGNNTSYIITGLGGGTRYYFAVTGYDSASGFESGFSNEVHKDIP